ncbi:putative leader peptide [Streptomyces polygonati]|uniref:Leader peptide n=1 Tax=Streptomyces polygonati TaxID=1617087 RepID=A0ABV8HYV3_9ACTN
MRAQLRPRFHRAVRDARTVHGTSSSAPAARRGCFHPAAVRVLVPGGPLIRLYGRQHIDLLRVAGALCCR